MFTDYLSVLTRVKMMELSEFICSSVRFFLFFVQTCVRRVRLVPSIGMVVTKCMC